MLKFSFFFFAFRCFLFLRLEVWFFSFLFFLFLSQRVVMLSSSLIGCQTKKMNLEYTMKRKLSCPYSFAKLRKYIWYYVLCNLCFGPPNILFFLRICVYGILDPLRSVMIFCARAVFSLLYMHIIYYYFSLQSEQAS